MERRTISEMGIFILFALLLVSCVEKEGYYDPGQSSIIDALTEKSWKREYHIKLDNGDEFDESSIWVFQKNGKGSWKTITTYQNGEEKEIITYFNWAFTTPNFNVIYMDYPRYWTIDKLTSNKLNIYETFDDPVTVPGQNYREYKEFITD